jgi:Ran GTPase-activating protein (RanGAP) involved in mRNA processing and transport
MDPLLPQGGAVRLPPVDMEETLKLLAANAGHFNLDLVGHPLGDVGAVALAVFVAGNPSTTHLTLNGNGIGDVGIAALSQAFMASTSLTYLKVSKIQLSIVGIRSLANALKINMGLEMLVLTDCSIGSEGAEALGDMLKRNKSLTILVLSNDEEAWNGIGIGDVGVKALTCALKGNSTLEQLYLGQNNIGIEGATALASALKLNTLVNLDLSFNSIGDEGVVALADALKCNTTLTELRLENCRIGDSGGAALLHVLKHYNTSLGYLSLDDNTVSDKISSAIDKVVTANEKGFRLLHAKEELDLSCKAVEDEAAHAVEDEDAAYMATELADNSVVTTLQLTNNKIGDAGSAGIAVALVQNQTLTTLGLGGNRIGDVGSLAVAVALRSNSTLTKLVLSHNNIGPAGVVALAETLKTNSSLTSLDLSGNGVNDEGATALLKVLKECNSTLMLLNLTDNPDISPDRLQAVKDVLAARRVFCFGLKHLKEPEKKPAIGLLVQAVNQGKICHGELELSQCAKDAGIASFIYHVLKDAVMNSGSLSID